MSSLVSIIYYSLVLFNVFSLLGSVDTNLNRQMFVSRMEIESDAKGYPELQCPKVLSFFMIAMPASVSPRLAIDSSNKGVRLTGLNVPNRILDRKPVPVGMR